MWSGSLRSGMVHSFLKNQGPECPTFRWRETWEPLALFPRYSALRWLAGTTQRNMAKQKQLSLKYQVWIDARKRHKLSHAHIQMARELGINPKKFGKLDNHKQEPWKAPLPIFIEDLYFKKFGKDRPENVRSVEQMVKDKKKKQLERKQRKLKAKENSQQDSGDGLG